MSRKLSAAATAAAAAVAVAMSATPACGFDSFRNDQWHLQALNIARAQSFTAGAGVTVAVVDTGTFPHPDLRRNLLEGTSFVSGEGRSGRVDSSGHGTNMAALIGGHGRGKSDGVLGIAPESKILPVRAFKSDRNVPSAAIGKGIEWAVNHEAAVVNVSASVGPAFEVEDAVAAAVSANAIIVASVGNSSQAAIIGYPAAINGVLAVGATDRSGQHAASSVKDPKVDICAPGVDITTAEPTNKYSDVSGTSPAAAIVSGAAALVRAKFPKLSGVDVIHRLTATADDIGPPGRDDECGFGRLNIVKALTADVPPLDAKTTTSSPRPTTAATPPGGATASATAPQAVPEGSGSTFAVVMGGIAGIAVAVGALAAARRRRRRKF
nr:S8 family serine peptidase [uncultured Actinoplanes sp.]